jgi:hypothetical protein
MDNSKNPLSGMRHTMRIWLEHNLQTLEPLPLTATRGKIKPS